MVRTKISSASEDKKCAPSLEYTDGSCYTLDLLIAMARGYNKTHSSSTIKVDQTMATLNPSKLKRHLVGEFKKKFSKCKTQRCWVKQEFMKQLPIELQRLAKKKVFRPVGPVGTFEWLDTINIEEVMKQYEDVYADFKFLGAVPMDFDSLPSLGIRSLDFKKLQEAGKHRIGLVFNLDNHDQSGSHWVVMYANLKEGKSYFFDSYGTRPEKRVRKLMRRIAKHIKRRGGNPLAQYNEFQHQRGNSECGVYSINFILRMLKGETFEQIISNPTSDKEVWKCREEYFAKA